MNRCLIHPGSTAAEGRSVGYRCSMHTRRRHGAIRCAAALTTCSLALAGCSAGGGERPVIGVPAPSVTPTETVEAMATRTALAVQWELTGASLPADWPDLPLPKGARVVTAYGVGTGDERSWTGTFTAESGTAADLARPMVASLRRLDFQTRTQYLGADRTNSGIFSLADDDFEVFIVLGEDGGRPSVAVTVRRPGPADTSDPTQGGPTLPSGD